MRVHVPIGTGKESRRRRAIIMAQAVADAAERWADAPEGTGEAFIAAQALRTAVRVMRETRDADRT